MRSPNLDRASRLGLLLALACGCGHDGGKGVADGGGSGTGGTDGGVVIVNDNDAGTCAAQSQKVERAPLDILVAQDTSYSMDFDNKWPAVKSALEAFIADPRSSEIGLGLQYFPLRAQCSVDDYRTPAVAVAPVKDSAAAIKSSLDAQRMSGGTPMVPVMEGALDYVRGLAEQNPTHKVVIVLATDGIPDDSCLAPSDAGAVNTLANVVDLAASGAAGTPSIKTFVIGVGSELSQLDQIAVAGGTEKAVLVDTAQDIEKAFLDALDGIRRTALACDYAIPTPAGGETINFDEVNVQFTSGGTSETFRDVGSADQCAKATTRGWYYDDPTNPTRVILCDETCARVQAAEDGQVDVLFGCATLVL